jgi:hypothetical protein
MMARMALLMPLGAQPSSMLIDATSVFELAVALYSLIFTFGMI